MGIIIIIGSNSVIINGFTNDSVDTTYAAMLEEELTNLNRIATDKALLVKEYLRAVITDIEMAHDYATKLFNGRLKMDPLESYWADTTIDTRTPTGSNFVDDYFGLGSASWDATTIFVPNVATAADYDALPVPTKDIIDLSSGLEVVFKAIHASNPNYIWIYMGFEQGSIFRQLPWNDMSWAREDNYIPVDESWYKSAVSASSGLNIFLDKDPESGLVVTASMPVKYDNGSLVGVISIDLPFDTVEQAVSGGAILENGYVYMTNENQETLIHPALLADATLFGSSIMDLEFSDSDENAEFKTKYTDLLGAGEQTTYIKGRETWYISESDVGIGKFHVFVTAPETDIKAPAEAIASKIRSLFFRQIFMFLVIIAVLSSGIVFIARWASDMVVKPITELKEVTDLIAKGNLNRDLKGETSSAEITMLYTTFQGLVTALRFGNQDYYAGDINKAMDNYKRALELFTTLKNEKGVGICHNNIGNIHRARGNLKDANQSYSLAIEIAESHLKNNTNPDERRQLVLSLASRYNNVGLLYKEIKQYDRAKTFINKALELDKEIDNAKGFATRYGNLGQVLLAEGKSKEAKNMFDEAMEIAKSTDSIRGQAYAHMNYGLYQRAVNDDDAAIEHFFKATELADEVDIRVVRSSLENVKEIYEMQGNKLAEEIEKRLSKLAGSMKAKEVTFVLDYSGSMTGKRIKNAVKGIRDIFKNQINDNDLVSIIIFHSSTELVLPTIRKADGVKKIMMLLDRLNRPTGATAFYDAVGIAFDDFLNRPTPNEQWIIALTDGDDNSSRRFNPYTLSEQAKRSVGVNLVIIGVGQIYDQDTLEEICSQTDKGTYINVADGVADAITSAFEEVGTMLSEVVVEGFVPDE